MQYVKVNVPLSHINACKTFNAKCVSEQLGTWLVSFFMRKLLDCHSNNEGRKPLVSIVKPIYDILLLETDVLCNIHNRVLLTPVYLSVVCHASKELARSPEALPFVGVHIC